MNYRFQKFATVDQEYLRQFKSRLPAREYYSFQELYDRFVGTHFGWVNHFARHLQALGNDAQDMFSTFEALQKLWAKEHGLRYDKSDWLRQIALAQIRAFQPDVLMLEDLYLLDQGFREQARGVCRRPVIIIGWRAAPTDDYTIFRDLDLLLTCVPNFAHQMTLHGANATVFRHAFEPSILATVPDNITRDIDFSFIGSLVLTNGFHRNRYALVRQLLQSTPLEVWSQISESQPKSWSDGQIRRLLGRTERALVKLRAPERIREGTASVTGKILQRGRIRSLTNGQSARFHPPVYGLDYFQVLARSRIAFNNHIDCAENYAGNIRLFEATGMGACLLTDWKQNLDELFQPNTEVLSYKSADECSEKVRYLLEHETERRAIAAAGQRRTFRDHTLEQRVRHLDEIIRGMISSKRAATRTAS